MSQTRLFLLLAAFNGLLAVLLGAFGAHALERVLEPRALDTWATAVQYQMFHVSALLAVALLASLRATPLLRVAGWSFALGILVFSGSLYLLALSGIGWLGAITPLGGLAFLLGWGLLLTDLLVHPLP